MQQWRWLLMWKKASACVHPLDRHDALWNHPDRQVTAKPLTNMSKQTNWPWLVSNSYRLDSGLQLVVLADALAIWASRPANLTTVHGVCVSSFNGYHDLPKQTGTDRNGPDRTETDLRKYRNGLLWVPKRTGTDFSGYRNGPEQTSAHTETNFRGKQKR